LHAARKIARDTLADVAAAHDEKALAPETRRQSAGGAID
jgi:hypothetical protein